MSEFRHIIFTPRGWVAAKAKYRTKSAAKDWTLFVKSAWHGMTVKVIEITEKTIAKYDLNAQNTAQKETL